MSFLLPKDGVLVNSNPHGKDNEQDCEEDSADVEEEDAKEEAEERRRPRQGKAINYGFAPDLSLLNIQHALYIDTHLKKKPEVGLDDGEESNHLVEVFWEPGTLTLVSFFLADFHFRIWTQRGTFETRDSSDIWSVMSGLWRKQ